MIIKYNNLLKPAGYYKNHTKLANYILFKDDGTKVEKLSDLQKLGIKETFSYSFDPGRFANTYGSLCTFSEKNDEGISKPLCDEYELTAR